MQGFLLLGPTCRTSSGAIQLLLTLLTQNIGFTSQVSKILLRTAKRLSLQLRARTAGAGVFTSSFGGNRGSGYLTEHGNDA